MSISSSPHQTINYKKIHDNEQRIRELRMALQLAKCDLLLAMEKCQELPLDERIVETLTEAGKFLPPHEIAHRVGFFRPNNQAHRVNAILYMLLDQGKIEKQTLHGGKKPVYGIPVDKK